MMTEAHFTQQRILIAGLGLIGGSAAKALKKAGCTHIFALDTDEATLVKAQEEGVIEADFAHSSGAFDIVICALAPHMVSAVYQQVCERLHEGGVFAELSGVKTCIVNPLLSAMRPEHALLCLHPMAGSERCGYDNADTALFRDAPMIFTPTEKTTDTAYAWAEFLAQAFGSSETPSLSAELHDAVVADLSHLPHVAALAVYSVGKGLARFAGGSFHAITRVAELNAPLWAGLLTDNAEYLLQSLARFRQHLDVIEETVRERDMETLEVLLANMAKGVSL